MSRDEDNAISLSCPSFGFRFGTGTAQELGLGLGTSKVKDQGRILDLIRFIQGFPMTRNVHRTVSL
jgi:hypothetical protein